MNALSVGLLKFVSVFSVLAIAAYLAQWFSHYRGNRIRLAGERRLDAILRDIALGEVIPASGARKGMAGKYLRPRAWMPILDAWIALSQSVRPDDAECARIALFFSLRKADLRFIRNLRSGSAYRRCRSAFYLGYLKTERARNALTLSLQQETKETVKLYLISALIRQDAGAALPDIIDSLKGCSPPFILRITGLILDLQSSFSALFPQLESRRESELLLMIVEFARLAPYGIFSGYLVNLLGDPATESALRQKVFACLAESYPYAINPSDYLHNPDPAIRDRAIEELANRPGKANAHILISYALEGPGREKAIASLSLMAQRSPAVFLYLVETARGAEDPERTALIYTVLSSRLEYFLLKLGEGSGSGDGSGAGSGGIYEKVVFEAIASGKLSDLISFMNRNNDVYIENRLIAIIQQHALHNQSAISELRMYLKANILQKIGLAPEPIPQKRINEKNESVRRGPFIAVLAIIWLIGPAFVAARMVGDSGLSLLAACRLAMNDYLGAFGWYALFVNLFYFLLAFLAWREAGKQSRFLRIKDTSFFFRKNLLPSISILAPAFNEELSIVSSVESLLNVNYPDFEVVVINDGSKDGTLDLLIDYFKLEKTDAFYAETLHTQPVRGIYANPRIPELKVIDKINGGKADSLNVGVNAASREYVLGIDSDSILERDALLTLTSAFLDEDAIVVASGGNIMPVNGCAVDRGVLEKKRIPYRIVPLLQTIEYLRAFMNGRMGWARLDSLMIISGAFGIFRRENVLAINGYLTSREKYEKDTVGEDMELVVRLSRSLREQSVRHKILYNYKANCWTEVPSSIRILKKQRDRWQRGLIDILSFHKKMMLNPRYGKYGLLGFPYYLAIEVIGPWLELLGNLFFVAGIATGWIDIGIFRFLIASNFIFSFALSVTSLYICDRDAPQFPPVDRIALILVSLVETLGFRQLMSFFRITGYMGVIRKVTGWGVMSRQGFSGKRSKA